MNMPRVHSISAATSSDTPTREPVRLCRGMSSPPAIVAFVSLTFAFASIAADDWAWANQVCPRDAGWKHVYIPEDGGCQGGPEWSCICAYRVTRGNLGCALEECETSGYRTGLELGGVTITAVFRDSLCTPSDLHTRQVGFAESGVACARIVLCPGPSDAGVKDE